MLGVTVVSKIEFGGGASMEASTESLPIFHQFFDCPSTSTSTSAEHPLWAIRTRGCCLPISRQFPSCLFIRQTTTTTTFLHHNHLPQIPHMTATSHDTSTSCRITAAGIAYDDKHDKFAVVCQPSPPPTTQPCHPERALGPIAAHKFSVANCTSPFRLSFVRTSSPPPCNSLLVGLDDSPF